MNGSVFFLAELTSYLKRSKTAGEAVNFIPGQHTYRLVFDFADGSEICDPKAWCGRLLKDNAVKFCLYLNFDKDKAQDAGFANAGAMALIVRYEDGRTTCWHSYWEFDKLRSKWLVTSKERILEGAPDNWPVYEDPTMNLKKALLKISDLARKISCDNFAEIFDKAYDILIDEELPPAPEYIRDSNVKLEGEALRLFVASSVADVFGGMGSWNDCPEGMADEVGLHDVYRQLSDELYTQIRKATLYALNAE